MTKLLTSVWHLTLGNVIVREVLLAVIFILVILGARRRYRASIAKKGARLNRNRTAWARRSGVRNALIWGLIFVAAVGYDRVWLNLNPELTVSAAVAKVTGHHQRKAQAAATKPAKPAKHESTKSSAKTHPVADAYKYVATQDGPVTGKIAQKIVRGYYATHKSEADQHVVSYKFVDDASAHTAAPLFRVMGYNQNHQVAHEYWVYSTGKFNVQH